MTVLQNAAQNSSDNVPLILQSSQVMWLVVTEVQRSKSFGLVTECRH